MTDASHYANRVLSLTKHGAYNQAHVELGIALRKADSEQGLLVRYRDNRWYHGQVCVGAAPDVVAKWLLSKLGSV